MPDYKAPIRDQLFVLHELLQITTQDVPGYSDLDPAFTEAILSEAGRIASDSLAPLNPVGDREGCHLDAGIVRTPTGFRQAFDSLRKGGWTAMDCDPAYGGQGLPYVIHTAAQEPFCSANMAFTMYHGLTHGAYSAIHTHGTPAQKAKFLPKLVSCDWTGTMNLTEPHAGTDLGLMRTKALPRPDGSYAISGTKIFISAGDHDMAENIIHLVLAKIPGGPEGIKGISLFIVPKVSVNDDGSLGAANGVTTGKLEEKMGIHGNATCELHFAQATGFLLGEAHKGMRAMFTMMNEARMGVGVQGYAQAEGAYQAARAYAQDRLQGRDITGPRNPAGAADPIIHHPDIRRALLDQKSFVEGARALTYWGATLLDRARHMQDAQADALLSLLTPVIKGFLTDMGFKSTVQAQQVFGGHGYIEDSGLSQFVRDARITMIYEGTNGVQALDLVGRKLALGGGKAIMAYLALIAEAVDAVAEDPALAAAFGTPLHAAAQDLQKAALYFMDHAAKDPNAALAGATDFLHLMGHVSLGLMWLRMAKAASAALAAGRGDAAFLRAKIATGRYYMARQLPMTATHLARITSGADPVMGMDPADF